MYYLYIRVFIENYELIACYSIKPSLIKCESKIKWIFDFDLSCWLVRLLFDIIIKSAYHYHMKNWV